MHWLFVHFFCLDTEMVKLYSLFHITQIRLHLNIIQLFSTMLSLLSINEKPAIPDD